MRGLAKVGLGAILGLAIMAPAFAGEPLTVFIGSPDEAQVYFVPRADLRPQISVPRFDVRISYGDWAFGPATDVFALSRVFDEFDGGRASFGGALRYGLGDGFEIFASATYSYMQTRFFDSLLTGLGAGVGIGSTDFGSADFQDATLSLGLGSRKTFGGEDGLVPYISASAAASFDGGGGGFNPASLGFPAALSFQVSGGFGVDYAVSERMTFGFAAGLSYESPRADEGKRDLMGELEKDQRTSTLDTPLMMTLKFRLN